MKLTPKTQFAKIRLSFLLVILCSASFFYIIEPLYHYIRYTPQEGDIIAQSLPYGELTELIEGATESNYSHVGILVKDNDEFMVNEAIINVHNTSLFDWIRRGKRNRFAVYRLKKEYQHHIEQTLGELDKYQQRPYDFRYDFDDSYIYCSELIYKAFEDATHLKMGAVESLGQLNWKPYKKTILKMENGNIPLERKMITPISLVKSIYLEKVFDNGL